MFKEVCLFIHSHDKSQDLITLIGLLFSKSIWMCSVPAKAYLNMINYLVLLYRSNNGIEKLFARIQRSLVTMNPSGQGKSVNVSRCHYRQIYHSLESQAKPDTPILGHVALTRSGPNRPAEAIGGGRFLG